MIHFVNEDLQLTGGENLKRSRSILSFPSTASLGCRSDSHCRRRANSSSTSGRVPWLNTDSQPQAEHIAFERRRIAKAHVAVRDASRGPTTVRTVARRSRNRAAGMDVRIDQGAESFDVSLKPRIEIETQLARQRQVGALSCGGDDPVNRADPLHSFGCLALKRGWRSRPFVFEGMAELISRVVAKRPFTPTKFSTS